MHAEGDYPDAGKGMGQMIPFRQLIEASADGVILINDRDEILFASSACEQLFAYTHDELLGQSFSILIPERFQERHVVHAARFRGDLRRRPMGTGLELWARRKDGLEFPVEIDLTPITTHGGQRQIVVTVRDVTDRRRIEHALQDSERFYRTIFEQAAVGVARIHSPTGRFVTINQRYCDIIGYSLAEMTQLNFQTITYPEDLPPDLAQMQLLRDGQIREFSMDKRLIHKNGDLVWVHLSVSAMWAPGEDPDYHIAVVQDISERKRAESSLEAEQQRSAMYLDLVEVIVLALDQHGHIRLINRKGCQILGYTPEELLGRNWFDTCLPADARETTRGLFERVIAGETGLLETAENRVLSRSGEEHLVAWHNLLVRDEAGRVVGTLSNGEEITRRRVTEEELRRLFRAIEASPVSVVITDLEGRMEYVNPKFTEVTGYTAQEVLGQTQRLLKSGVQPPEFYADMWRVISSGQEWKGEFCNRKKTGELYWESSSISPVRNTAGVVSHYVAVKEDITLRRQTEHELATAKAAAETANRAKTLFLASMSHEIRTPLNAILGFAQLLQREPGLTAHQQEWLETIRHSGEHLVRLIGDVLDMSKIEFGHILVAEEEVDLSALLSEVEEMVRLFAQEKGLVFEVQRLGGVPWCVRTDPSKLRQVLLNVLGNAVKYTKEGRVTMRVWAESSGGNGSRLWVEVEDTGPGIEAAELGTLFDYFEQAKSGRELGEGAGLGLAISREYARALGGDVTVRSELGRGSTFCVQTSLVEVQGNGEDGSPTAVEGLRTAPIGGHCRVLIADDVAENRQMLVSLLVQAGFAVRAAESGNDAVRMFEEWQPQVVLMDLRMPGGDGCEAIRCIRSTEAGRQTVVVAVTAGVSDESRQQAMDAGADGFVPKPVRFDSLLEVIRKHLGCGCEATQETSEAAVARRTAAAGTTPFAAVLPAGVVEEMQRAILSADSDRLNELIGQVVPLDAGAAAKMQSLVDRYEYDLLREFLENTGHP